MRENQIKKLRQSQNLSQEMLAEKAQVSVRTIQRLEAGEEASVETLNLVAGALGVGIKDLYDVEKSSDYEEKIASADQKLQCQLGMRHNEYKNFKQLYGTCYIILMLLWGALFGLVPGGVARSVMGVLWVGGWMIMGPLQKYIVLKKVSPKLDAKYPMTANRLDKNEIHKKENDD